LIGVERIAESDASDESLENEAGDPETIDAVSDSVENSAPETDDDKGEAE
jgi:hypothetical protein